MLRTFTVILVVLLGASTTRASSQEPEQGTLEIHVFNDLDGNGRFSPDYDSTDLLSTCTVKVYPNLRAAPAFPITELRPDPAGQVSVSLPAGVYSIAHEGCFRLTARLNEDAGFCCPRLRGDPAPELLRTERGAPWIVVQTIEVQPGATTVIAVFGAPEPSANEIWMYVWITAGVLLGAIVIGSVWKFRPRYEPRSDAKHPKELPPHLRPDPDYEPADFDRVFGELADKKRDDAPPDAWIDVKLTERRFRTYDFGNASPNPACGGDGGTNAARILGEPAGTLV